MSFQNALMSVRTLVLLITATGFAGAQNVSPPATWRNTPATPSGVIQRMEDAAVKFQESAPIPRSVFYDIGYPGTDEELLALDGNALILLTAVSQSREELPLSRAFVLGDGTEIPLKQVRLVLSQQPLADSLLAKVFGRYRSDSLYLLPVYLRLKRVDLIVEFGGGNRRFTVATFGSGISAAVSRLQIVPPTGNGPTEAALNVFIRREFPGF